MRNKFFVRRVLRLFMFGVILALFLVASPLLPSTGAAAQNTTPGRYSTSEAPIKFWNRVIAVQRATLVGAKLEQASDSTMGNLAEALQARTAERSWPVIRRGLSHTLIGLVVLSLSA